MSSRKPNAKPRRPNFVALYSDARGDPTFPDEGGDQHDVTLALLHQGGPELARHQDRRFEVDPNRARDLVRAQVVEQAARGQRGVRDQDVDVARPPDQLRGGSRLGQVADDHLVPARAARQRPRDLLELGLAARAQHELRACIRQPRGHRLADPPGGAAQQHPLPVEFHGREAIRTSPARGVEPLQAFVHICYGAAPVPRNAESRLIFEGGSGGTKQHGANPQCVEAQALSAPARQLTP